MTLDKDLFRQPRFWQIAVPALLFLYAAGATFDMFAQKKNAQEQKSITENAYQHAREIKGILDKVGSQSTVTSETRAFDGVASARKCAQVADIPEVRLSRGESSSPKKDKDGTVKIMESFKLRGVKLIQIARFVDFAEKNYDTLKCTQITITNSRNPKKDHWDADINMQYTKN